MKWLKRILIAVAALVLVLAVVPWWLLGTTGGLHFVLARVVAASDGALSVEQAHGTLAGPLTIRGLQFAKDGTELGVREARVDVELWPLLGGTLRVRSLAASGIVVTLPATSEHATRSETGVSLKPPLDLVLDEVHVRGVDVRQAGKSLFQAERIDVAGAWTGEGVRLDKLLVRAPDGHADAHGRLLLGTALQGRGELDFGWTLSGREFVGTLKSRSDGTSANAVLTLSKPLPATLHLELRQGGDYPWSAHLEVPESDASPLLGEGDIKTVAADLEASGTRERAQVRGKLQVNQWPVRIDPLRLARDPVANALSIETLHLTSPRVPGTLDAHGQLVLDASPLAGELDLAWHGVELPPELAGQRIDSHGAIRVRGSLADYRATGEVHMGPPQQLADLKLDVQGDDKQLVIHSLNLRQNDGDAELTGHVSFRPALRWDVRATGRRFDPGQLVAGWNGALDFDLDSKGRQDRGLDASLALNSLGGLLRGREVSGSGTLHLSPARVLDGKLNVEIGKGHVAVQADGGSRNDIHVELHLASLGDWLPDSSGSVEGKLRLRGTLDKPALTARLDAHDLRWRQDTIEALTLDADIPDLRIPGGRLEIRAERLQMAGFAFDKAGLDANGTEARHSARLQAQGPRLRLALLVDGHMSGKTWNGELTRLDLEPQGIAPWHLTRAAPIAIAADRMDVGELCLSAGDPQLCLRAQRTPAGTLDASYRIRALPLALVSALISDPAWPVSIDGIVAGTGELHRSAAGVLAGHAQLQAGKGSITWLDSPSEPLLGWQSLRVNADFEDDRQSFELHGALDHQGTLDGRLSMAGAAHNLDGHLELQLDSLAFAALLNPQLANVKGELDARFAIAGQLDSPAVSGQASVRDFAAEIPALGLKLTQGEFEARTRSADTLALQGQVKSGQGTLRVDGDIGIANKAATLLKITGQQVTAADIPAARIAVSPDLEVEHNAQGVRIEGSVAVDHADVDVEKLPGAGATQASPDVVIMDQPQQKMAGSTPLSARIVLKLGDHTQLKGFGLDGKLSGQLVVMQRPGRAPTGQGQIEVDGTYVAYGQALQIQRGRLLFASTPLGNPGLDIRAVRSLRPNATIDEGQQVGLQVSGTAMRPVVAVFSNPTMSQSDALSYLVTGKPLSQVKGGEGNLVGAAAQALGSATGDLLAKSIGSKLGIDDIGVSSNQALGGNAAFTVGKYLSPRLYLNYGVGLFEPGTVVTLRYLLSNRWNFEATQATDFSRASFNYRYEK